MRGRRKSDGRVGKIEQVGTADKSMTYKIKFDDQSGDGRWYPADAVECLAATDGSDEAADADDSDWSRKLMLGVTANLVTLTVVGMLYMLRELLASYLLVILYAFLFSEALWVPKMKLQKMFRGWLSHTAVGLVLVLSLICVGAVVLGSVSVAGFLDVARALGDTHGWVSKKLTAEALKAWGIDETMIHTGLDTVFDKLESLEHEYNTTIWWSFAAHIADLRHSMNATCTDFDTANIEGLSLNVTCGNNTLEDLRKCIISSQCCRCGWGVKDLTGPWWEDGSIGVSLVTFTQALDFRVLTDKAHIIWNTLSSQEEFHLYLQAAANHVFQAFGMVFRIVTSLTTSVTTAVFFVSLTISLLGLEKNILHELIGGLFGDEVEDRIRRILGGVFFYPPALATCRLFFTFTVAQGLWLPYAALMAMLTCLVTFVPMLSAYPFVTALPWMVGRAVKGDYASALSLFLVQYFVLGSVEEYLLGAAGSGGPVPPWATGLAIVLGFERFGVQAFFLGPLTASMLFLMRDEAMACFQREEDEIRTTPSGRLLPRKNTSTMRMIAAGISGTVQETTKRRLSRRYTIASLGADRVNDGA